MNGHADEADDGPEDDEPVGERGEEGEAVGLAGGGAFEDLGFGVKKGGGENLACAGPAAEEVAEKRVEQEGGYGGPGQPAIR